MFPLSCFILFVARDGGGNYSDSANEERDDHNTQLMQSTEYPALYNACYARVWLRNISKERENVLMFLNVTLSRSECYPGIQPPDNVGLNKGIYSIYKIIIFLSSHDHLGQDFHSFRPQKDFFSWLSHDLLS